MDNILSFETDSIIAKHYDANEPEIKERLKLSINTMSDLIDRGAKILPSTNDTETRLQQFKFD